jgi:hypothetical protein
MRGRHRAWRRRHFRSAADVWTWLSATIPKATPVAGLRLACVCLAFVLHLSNARAPSAVGHPISFQLPRTSSLGSWSSHIIPTAEDKLPRQLVIPYHSNCRGQAPSAVGHPISFQLPRTSSLGSWSSVCQQVATCAVWPVHARLTCVRVCDAACCAVFLCACVAHDAC